MPTQLEKHTNSNDDFYSGEYPHQIENDGLNQILSKIGYDIQQSVIDTIEFIPILKNGDILSTFGR